MLVTVQCTMRSQRPVAAKMAAAVRMKGSCMIFPLRSVEIRGGGGGGVCIVFVLLEMM